MKAVVSSLLLLCFGALLPAAAMPVRICLLHPEDRTEDCCGECPDPGPDGDRQPACCKDREVLPDSSSPGGSLQIPPFSGHVVPFAPCAPPASPESILPALSFVFPRTGIGPPTARLAVLAIWRI